MTKHPVLYGAIQKTDLLNEPFAQWFVPNYNDYEPNAELINAIRRIVLKDITLQIFMGTWCGDSRREVPRFLKLLETISFPLQQVQLIGLGGDSLVKQSPQHEEAGKGIFRVPTFIVNKNGVETGRINEFPMFSLEKDLFAILSGQSYTPNYKTFAVIKKWLADGTLLDKNISSYGLAAHLYSLAAKESELNSLGSLLLKQGKKQEGLRVLQINAVLYPESANASLNVGKACIGAGDLENAVMALEKAIELNKEPQRCKEILQLLYQAKGVRQE